jgi:hypothetical protein
MLSRSKRRRDLDAGVSAVRDRVDPGVTDAAVYYRQHRLG